MRNALTWIFRTAATLAGATFLASMLYGVFTWPAAPIRSMEGQFRDKRGNVRTAEEYASFKTWESTLWISGVSTFVLAFVGESFARRSKWRPRTEAPDLPPAVEKLMRSFTDENPWRKP